MSSISAGSIITRTYNNFRGVDFSDDEVSQYRSPNSLNMWKDYKKLGKCIETRPDIELYQSMSNSVYGIFPYTINTIEHLIIHSGTSLFDLNMNTKGIKKIKENGMNPIRSYSFIYNNILYIKDGINYLTYDGDILKDVEGFIPTTSISRSPSGGGKDYQHVNLINSYRKNSFCADGKSKDYYLDSPIMDNSNIIVWINNIKQTSGYSVNISTGCVTFITAPNKPDTDGEDNVIIQYSKTISGNKEMILKCKLLEVFDNRVFFAGNIDYPNTIFHSSLDNPTYISDEDHYSEGMDGAIVKAMIASGNALYTFKEPSSSNTSVFYHVPSEYTDSNTGLATKAYASQHSSISKGCIATAINFNDDIVMFSSEGMEGITGSITSEQVLSHRSSVIDSKLLQERNYKNMILQEFVGYLLVIIDNHIYLADSRSKFTNASHTEYEWFYWELSKNITSATVKNEILYLGTEDGIYSLTKVDTNINSYWTTCEDVFDAPNYQKITNKRGCICDLDGNIVLSVKTDNRDWEKITLNENTNGYLVPRIKEKKWKKIQFKFSSNEHFGLYDFTIQSFMGSFVKR